MFGIPRFDSRPYHWHYMNGFLQNPDAHPFLKEANARFELYTKAAVYVNPNEFIVGNLDWALAGEPVINRIGMHMLQRWVIDEIRTCSSLSAEETEEFEQKLQQMMPHIHLEKLKGVYSSQARLAEESSIASCCHYNGHQVLDYGKLLCVGIQGIVQEAAQNAANAQDATRKVTYQAIQKTFEGTAQFIRRHADAARDILAQQEQGYQTRQLETIIETCEAVADGVPQTFLQGLQLQWFFMGFADYDSFGRFDQYMYPLYKKSLAQGESRTALKQQLEEFWRKLDQNGSILNMTAGGKTPQGEDAVNELTYLVLEVTREMKLKGPNLCLRISADSDKALWEAAKQGIGSQNALPALYNEDLILPMLLQHGFAPQDANDYCLAGCSQVLIPGKSSFACDMGEYSTPKCLELALNGGYDPLLKQQVGPHTGAPETLKTFEDVCNAYRAQAAHAIAMGVELNNKDHDVRGDTLSCIRSALTADCLQKGTGLYQGGARYYAVQNEVVGLTNTADSLAAIQKAVFEEKKYTLREIVDACNSNYEGKEEMRLYLRNKMPKFGNDEETVDALRVQIQSEFFQQLAANKAPLGGVHWPGEVIFHYHVAIGQYTGATPDGRKAGQPFADSAGASQGTDMQGPTGILNSMAKIPFTTPEYPNTCSCLNLKFTKQLWDKADDKIIDLFRTYFKRGGYQLQINVTNQEQLLDAKKNPEKHRSLVVRVGGYNGYFVGLDPKIQDDIIARHGQTQLS